MIQGITLETRLMLELEGRGLSVFTTKDAKDILKTGDSSVWHILHGLARKNRIERIERGRYLLIPARAGVDGRWTEYPWAVLPSLLDVYYVAFLTAMNYWGMTEQVPYTVFVATTKRRRHLEYGGQRFRFVTLSPKKFFGLVQRKAGGGASFSVSSREKTIVDGLAHPEYCGGIAEVAKAMWSVHRDVDWGAVSDMSERVGSNAVLKRLGYLLSVMNIEEGISERIRKKVGKTPYNHLDPAYKKAVKTSPRYRLTVGLADSDLLSWRGS